MRFSTQVPRVCLKHVLLPDNEFTTSVPIIGSQALQCIFEINMCEFNLDQNWNPVLWRLGNELNKVVVYTVLSSLQSYIKTRIISSFFYFVFIYVLFKLLFSYYGKVYWGEVLKAKKIWGQFVKSILLEGEWFNNSQTVATVIVQINILSVESQKGVITIQQCSVESQKGIIAVQSLCH